MERVLVSPIINQTWAPKEGYYMSLPYEYYDIYFNKMMRINCATYAAEEQSMRILTGLDGIKGRNTK
jgi:hypothetical protein